MAQFEHELWMQARQEAGFVTGKPTAENPRRNEYLVPWDEVPDDIKQIDRYLVCGIPTILAKAGYAVLRLRAEA